MYAIVNQVNENEISNVHLRKTFKQAVDIGVEMAFEQIEPFPEEILSDPKAFAFETVREKERLRDLLVNNGNYGEGDAPDNQWHVSIVKTKLPKRKS